MKINNEYVNTKNYTDNFFAEDLNALTTKEGLFSKAVEGVSLSKSETVENGEKYNKYGEHSDNTDNNVAENSTKGFDIESLKESLKNVMGEMDGSDYERLKQWGLAPAEADAEEVVTVYERIQIQLMTYCEDYNASGLSIDKDKMAQVLGSQSMAEAVAKSSDLTKYTDDTKEYMLKNDLEPTVDNVYMSIHSAAKKEVKVINDPAVQEAVSEKLSSEGFELNKENIENAMWLVSRGVEVNSKNMTRLAELNQIDELKNGNEAALEILSRNISYSLYAGQSSKNAYVTDRYVNADDVYDVIETINDATDEDIEYVALNNLVLNAANLKKAQEADKSAMANVSSPELKVVEFKQVIFEARIVMTTSSVFNLKRLGVDINYAEISQMTDDIVNERNQLLDMMMRNVGVEANDASKQLFADTIAKMNNFSSLPQGVICKVHTQEITFSMDSVYAEGVSLKNQYESAMISYETLSTEVRYDLGDSYLKAFSNVDSLLSELDMEINSANQRAVRILGYNSMEITQENVISVREIAAELDYLIENMTPKTALHLIKKGINPLQDDIREVNKMLEKINEELGKDEENMGKFLWNLEKKGEVTAEEKADYIELYRILNMISKNDGNVIGRVISEGKELTLKNLYSAYKSKKAGDFDYSLSDEYAVSYVKKGITTFMEHSEAISEVMENGQPKDISVERMIDIANDYMAEEDKSYYEDEMKRYESLVNVSKNELEAIVKNLDSQSISNIATYMEMSNTRSLYKKLKEYNETTDIIEEVAAELEGEGDVTDLNSKLEQLEAAGKELLETTKNSKDITYEKLQGAMMMAKTLQVMNSQAKKSSYFVPMEIGGEITNVHLKINHIDAAMSNVTVAMENKELGRISSIFTIRKAVVTGRIVSDNEESVRMLSQNIEVFTRAVETVGLHSGEISCYKSSNEASYKYEAVSEENVSVNTYYSVAKAFIGMVKVSV